MIYYKCPKCKSGMDSPESLAGQEETCPNCGNVAIVPQSDSGEQTQSPASLLGVEAGKASAMPAGGASKTHWAGIIALLLGLVVGGWAANGIYGARQKGRLNLAFSRVQLDRAKRESANWSRGLAAPPTTPLGQAVRERLSVLEEENAGMEDKWRIDEFVTRGGLGAVAWAVAVGGGGLALTWLVISIMTRRSDVGIGICAGAFFFAALGAGCLLTGLAHAGLHAQNVAMRQAAESHGMPLLPRD